MSNGANSVYYSNHSGTASANYYSSSTSVEESIIELLKNSTLIIEKTPYIYRDCIEDLEKNEKKD